MTTTKKVAAKKAAEKRNIASHSMVAECIPGGWYFCKRCYCGAGSPDEKKPCPGHFVK